MPTKVPLRELTVDERVSLEMLAHSRIAETRLVERAQIIVAAVDGDQSRHIVEHIHVTRVTVRQLIRRFNADGIDGLHDLPRSGRPATYPANAVAAVIATVLTNSKRT
jgi:transposase